MLRWAAFMVVALGAVAAADGTAPPPIVTFAASELELVDSGEKAVVYVPVATAEGIAVDALTVDVLSVAVGNRYDPGLASQIVGRGDAATGWIALDVTLAKLHERETYAVTLRVSAVAPAKPVAPVTQVVKLRHAGTRARVVPETIVIERTGWYPGGGTWRVPDTIELQDLTGKSQLTSTRVVDLRDARADGEPVGTPVAIAVPAIVPRGDPLLLAVTVFPGVPNDTVTGKLELRAPQLDEPVAIKYELRTNVWPGTIVFLLVIGLVIGFTLKPRIHERLDRLRWQREVAEIAKAASVFATHVDKDLADAAKGIIERCKSARAQPEKTAVARDKTRGRLQLELDDAAVKWRDRLANAKVAAIELERIVETAWRMPTELAPVLETLRTQAREARTAVEAGDARTAAARLEAADNYPSSVTEPVQQLKASIAELVRLLADQLAEQLPPWPFVARSVASETASDLKRLADGIADPAKRGAAALAGWLASAHALETTIGLDAVRMHEAWRTVLSAARRELPIEPDPLAGVDDALPTLDDDPRAYLHDIATNARTTVKAVADRLLALAPKARVELVRTYLDNGAWSRAAAAALPPDDDELEAATRGFVMRAPPVLEPMAPASTHARVVPLGARSVLVAPGADVDTMLRDAIRAENVGRWTTSIISGAVLVLLYFAGYAGKTLHTWPELLAVFAQAISIDLGVDAVIQRFRTLAG